jgi:iron complex outermembrane recepter protein
MKIMPLKTLVVCMRQALALSLVLTPAAAMAQDPATADPAAAAATGEEEAKEMETVTVTGTRVQSPGTVSNSPISSVTQEDIEKTQPVAVEEFLRAQPAAVPAMGPGMNNGTAGAATLDLRGLGPNRNLVLIDGRRLVPFNLQGVVDTNVVPIAMLERVDIVTGGASAVYGADAITGVVNFVLKRDFEGVEASSAYGVSGDDDAERYRADVVFGANLADYRGNVMFGVGYTQTDPLRQGERSFGQVSRSSVSGNPQGSGTAVPAVVGTTFGNLGGQINPATGAIDPDIETYNFNPLNYFVTPLERYQATAIGNFFINEYAEAYAQAMYTRGDVGSTLAPSGTFLNDYLVPIGNPYLPEPARQQICADIGIAAADCVAGNPQEVSLTLGRRFVELGPRRNDFQNKTFQYTLGLRGAIAGTWNYDAYWSYGESDQVQTRGSWGSNSRVQQALRAVSTTQCLNTANGCVPLNIFGAEGSITPEMIGFFNLDALLTQSVQQSIVSASVNGDLGNSFKSPWTDFPIGVAIGVERRSSTAGNRSDSASQIQGEVLGTGAPTPDVSGSFSMREAFAEFAIPLLNDAPFAHSLSLEAGYRQTEFSTTVDDRYGSYKFGGEWAPVESFRIRGLYQRATRAPNVSELFAPVVTGLSNLAVDPCAGAVINQGAANTAGTLSNLCRLTGVPLNLIGQLAQPSAGQVNVIGGGNVALGPEEADTQTIGFVWSPSFARGFNLTLDYYDIELQKAITAPSVTDILSDCYDPARNPGLAFNSACALIGRGPSGTFNGTGSPGIGLNLSNLGVIKTDGIDLDVSYRFDIGGDAQWGALTLALSANKALHSKFRATPGSVERECLGYYSIACGNIVYDYKWNQRSTWSINDFDVSLNWRHVSSVIEEPGGQNFLPAYASIDAYDYFDLATIWRMNSNVRFNLTINNLFDKGPPEVGNTIGGTAFNSGNTFPQFYDTVGRYFTVGGTVSF